MENSHDIVAAVAGPGWKYGLSRIVIDGEGNGAVFIAGSQEPYAEFTVVNISTSKGSGVTADGEITWRRRGSSCQYKLAKCKVSTGEIMKWWADAKAKAEPKAEEKLEDLL